MIQAFLAMWSQIKSDIFSSVFTKCLFSIVRLRVAQTVKVLVTTLQQPSTTRQVVGGSPPTNVSKRSTVEQRSFGGRALPRNLHWNCKVISSYPTTNLSLHPGPPWILETGAAHCHPAHATGQRSRLTEKPIIHFPNPMYQFWGHGVTIACPSYWWAKVEYKNK